MTAAVIQPLFHAGAVKTSGGKVEPPLTPPLHNPQHYSTFLLAGKLRRGLGETGRQCEKRWTEAEGEGKEDGARLHEEACQ